MGRLALILILAFSLPLSSAFGQVVIPDAFLKPQPAMPRSKTVHTPSPRPKEEAGEKNTPIAQTAANKSDNGRFLQFASGVILDTQTNLEWFPCPDRDMSWEHTREWVEGMTEAGGGWRIPSRDQLKSFATEKQATPGGVCHRSPLIPWSGSCKFAWTSETGERSLVWAYDFYYGKEQLLRSSSGEARALAVRPHK